MNSISTLSNQQTSEWQALVYFCYLGIRGEDTAEPLNFKVEEIDWAVLKKQIVAHRVKPLVHQGMVKWSRKNLIPEDLLKWLASHHQRQSYTNMDHAKEMVQLIRMLSDKGVEVIPYKGVILGQEAYGDMGLREMSDIDLLMNLGEFPVIRDLLTERDYVPSKNVPEHFEATFFKQNFEYNFDLYEGEKRKYHVEPHWKIGFKRWQTDLTFAEILPLTSKKAFFGTSLNILSPEGLLLTTSLHHGGEDRWNSLKYICDIAALLFTYSETMNWQLLLSECDKFKVRNLVLLGISAAVSIFNAPVPENVLKAIHSKKIQTHTQKVELQLKSNRGSANINTYFKDIAFHCSLRQSPVTKLKVLYYHLTQVFVPTIYDINDHKSSGKKYWWLFLTKPFRIWRTHVKTR